MALSDFHLITDRTQMDVDRWAELKAKGWQGMSEEERAEWQSPMKGCYNYTDMNRVEAAVEYVAARLREYGYAVRPVVKKNWSRADIPTKEDLDRYLKNIRTLRTIFIGYPTTPATLTIDQKMSYREANDLEQILIDVDEILTKMIEAWFHLGDVYAGEI